MVLVKNGASHHRLNKSNGRINQFKKDADNVSWLIWNTDRWEKYQGTNPVGIVPISTSLKKKTKKAESKPKQQLRSDISETKFDPIIPTLAEEAMDYIPSPVLRELIKHYKTADKIEVEIHVKSTHVIKG